MVLLFFYHDGKKIKREEYQVGRRFPLFSNKLFIYNYRVANFGWPGTVAKLK